MTASSRLVRRPGSSIPGHTYWACALVGYLLAASAAAATPLPQAEPQTSTAGITGLVRASDGQPLARAEVVVRQTGGSVLTDAEGRFAIAGLTPGIYTLQVMSDGFVPQERDLELSDGTSVVATAFDLLAAPRFLTEVVVTPSLYSLYASQPEVATALSREEVERLPHLAQDVFRAARWLPGTSGEDFSALMNVRGGEVDETLVLVDGLEVQEAFHLQELFGGVQSVLDAEAVDGLEFMSGGFPVEFGNRMSGVINTRSAASGPRRTSLGASTTHLGVFSTGPFATERGRWLLSLRRTNLDNVIGWIDPESGLEPLFYDALGKISFVLGGHTVLSANVLGAWDRTRLREESVDLGERTSEQMDSTSSRGYAWLSLTAAPSSRLSVETVASAGRLEREVDGSTQSWSQTGVVTDQRVAELFGLKQDWRLDLADRHLLKWGFELRLVEGHYDHQSHSTIHDVLFATGPDDNLKDYDCSLDPRGSVYSAYAADRLRLGADLVAELGFRWDHQSYTDDHQLSPRLNLVRTLGDRTTLRGAWGLYHQPQHINELQVSDGLTEYQLAQQAEHRLVSLEHHLPWGLGLRVELYQKKMRDVRARYENLLNPVEIFPELESDRVLVAANRAEARGIEVAVRNNSDHHWGWWLSYAYARAEDHIEDEWVPRSRDQPHTASFSLNYRPSKKWNLNLAGIYHTGWPTTAVLGEVELQPDGGHRVRPYLGPRNAERYPGYLRFDLRASRIFDRGPGTWMVFVEVMNLLNRENRRGLQRIVDYYVDDGGTVQTIPQYRTGFPLLPSLGLRWSF